MAARKTAAPTPPKDTAPEPEQDQTPEPEPTPEAPPAPDEPDAPDVETATNVRTGETVITPRTSVEHAYVDALRRERAGYVTYGREDRVAAVDAELERWGATAETD